MNQLGLLKATPLSHSRTQLSSNHFHPTLGCWGGLKVYVTLLTILPEFSACSVLCSIF